MKQSLDWIFFLFFFNECIHTLVFAYWHNWAWVLPHSVCSTTNIHRSLTKIVLWLKRWFLNKFLSGNVSWILMLPGKLMLFVFWANYPLLIWMDLVDSQNFYPLFLPILHSNSKFVHYLESSLKKKKNAIYIGILDWFDFS